jgi:drug/metabolite transporter (DMT)-like permease
MFKYHLIALFVVAIWGTTFISSKLLLEAGMSPVEIVSIRFFLAYLGMLAYNHHRLWSVGFKHELIMLALGVTGGSLYFAAENYALTVAYCTNVAIIIGLTPLLTAFLDALVHHKKLSWWLLLGSLVAFGGAAMVILGGGDTLHFHFWGDLLAFIAAFLWSAYTVLTKKVDAYYPTSFIIRKVFFYGFITLLPFHFMQYHTFDFTQLLNPIIGGNLLFLSLCAALMCYLLWNIVVKKIGAIACTNYLYLQPAVTMLVSSWVFGEPVTFFSIAGLVVTIVGLYLADKGRK